MTEVLIRPPRAGDGPDLAAIWLEEADYYVELDRDVFQVPRADGLAAWLEQEVLKAASDHKDDACVLVAERGGRVVGFVMAAVARPGAHAPYQIMRELSQVRLLVNSLTVRESHRRQRIGTRLMQAIEAWGRGRGAVVAQLDTYAGSPLSVPFYEQRMGYRRQAVVFRKALHQPSTLPVGKSD